MFAEKPKKPSHRKNSSLSFGQPTLLKHQIQSPLLNAVKIAVEGANLAKQLENMSRRNTNWTRVRDDASSAHSR